MLYLDQHKVLSRTYQTDLLSALSVRSPYHFYLANGINNDKVQQTKVSPKIGN